ncbi:ubiquitin-like domain-containing protein [Streptomyces caniscabiei]|uniref:ubiquitin-like domain-containing protein n=1 Tax=Streptomyces caniscabiei TaxID=2746961 RepID=UPI0029A5211A|nr:ubiquitin-like domain-containing protein [Streptomyces caniscabiei]MDX2776680.1 ubiquitin-like domain-containing protein [Streptomyces caniscabiei]
MKSITKRTPFDHRAIIALSAIIAFFFGIISLAAQAYAASEEPPRPAAGERLITIHDDGKDRGILTKATTLRQAFESAGIRIDPSDRVEPGLDDQLVASNYEVNIYRARPVTIVDGAVRVKVMSAYQTPQQIAERAGIELHDEDIVTLGTTEDIVAEGTGLKLSIDRATPFTFILYGKSTTAYTQEKTVGEMLAKKNVTLGPNDTLSVPASTPIAVGMTVELWRNGVQTVTEEQEVPFEIEKIQDKDREVGYKEVKTPGQKGKKTVTFEVEMKNGKEISRKEIQSVVSSEPKKQVEIVGAKLTNTFNGSFAEALARLRSCEGSYTSNTGNGYYGAYQFDIRTWGGYGGYANASLAPPEVQDQKAWETYQRRGWQPWPACSRSLGLQDIYR